MIMRYMTVVGDSDEMVLCLCLLQQLAFGSVSAAAANRTAKTAKVEESIAGSNEGVVSLRAVYARRMARQVIRSKHGSFPGNTF